MRALVIGPFFSLTTPTARHACNDVVPLGVQLEWASAEAATRIDLFAYKPGRTTSRFGLEHILVPADQLPFALECLTGQVVQRRHVAFVPLETLLFQLYSQYQVGCGVINLLRELLAVVPLHCSIPRQAQISGLLVDDVEQGGFVLNRVIPARNRLHVEIGWHPINHGRYVFHTCLCVFHSLHSEGVHTGQWQPPALPGIGELLTRELKITAAGKVPGELFTPAGRQFLQSYSHQIHSAAPD